MNLKLALAVISLIVVGQASPIARDKAEALRNVLVVRNSSSPISCRIAAYYMKKRHIDSGNLVTINIPDSALSSANEVISVDDYRTKIQDPIRQFLQQKKLTDRVQYIVLTKGIPIRIPSNSAQGIYGESVDSLLAATDLVAPLVIRLGTQDKPTGTPFVNRYWRATEPFSHHKYGGYLVTRLDGYTEADAKALVDRAMERQTSPSYVLLDAKSIPTSADIAKQPISLIMPDASMNRGFQIAYGDFDSDMVRASEIIQGRPGLSVNTDKTKEFVVDDHPLTLYVSWGSNAGSEYSLEKYHKLKFAPRSIVETAVSSSGRSFLPTTGGQSMIADMIAQGAAGAKGYVTEPYLFAMASPTVLVDEYTKGRNLAESFYASSRFLAWKDVVLGDPLCRLDVVGR